MNSHLVSPNGILIFTGGKQYQVASDHPNFSLIRERLAKKDYSEIPDLVDTRNAIRRWFAANPRVSFVNDRVAVDGVAFSDAVTAKVFNMLEAGNDATALINFLVKVRRNPSAVSQAELLLFCEANNFMIHEDGDILAYKSVRNDWFDAHSGSVFNKPFALMTEDERVKYAAGVSVTNASGGAESTVTTRTTTGRTIVSTPRFMVDDERERTCSFGLHFAAYDYARGFSQNLLLIKVDPADVVSIPSDYNNQKGRCARYEVVAHIETREPLPHREVYTDSDIFDDLSDEDDCDCWDCSCDD